MKRFHLIFGLVMLVAFLLTGQYMDRFHEHLRNMADGPRMLYRTRHIFILFSGLLHIGIGTYFSYRLAAQRRMLQIVGSLLATIASVLFVIAFFYEPQLTHLYAPLSKAGVIMTATGVLLHALSGVNDSR
jgi:uncharacterized membrane protein YbhN (UPF0104 family)